MTSRVARRWLATTLVVLGCLLLAGVQSAHAASLRLAPGTKPYVTTLSRCGTGPVTVRPSGTAVGGKYTRVTASGVTGPCSAGRVVVYTAATGAVSLDGTGTLSAGSFTGTTATSFTPPTAAAGQAYVTLDGWPVAANWDPTPVVAPTVSCRVLSGTSTCTGTITKLEYWNVGTNGEYNLFVEVTSPSATPDATWEITVNLADPSLPFVPRRMDNNNQSQLAAGWTCAQMPNLVLTGQTASSTSVVGGTKTVSVYLHGYQAAGTGGLFTCP